MSLYERKYLKYKNKYLELKYQSGGFPGQCTFILKNKENAKLLLDRNCKSEDIKKFEVKVLKEAGFTAAQLKAAGFTAAQLKADGFTTAQLIEVFKYDQLKDIYTIQQLKDAGAKLEYFDMILKDKYDQNLRNELAEAKFELYEYQKLKKYLYENIGPTSIYNQSPEDLKNVYKFTLKDFAKTNWDVQNILNLFPKKDFINDFVMNFSIKNLIDAKFTIEEINKVKKYELIDYLDRKVDPIELKKAGYTISDFREIEKVFIFNDIFGKFSRKAFPKFTIHELKNFGFTLDEIINIDIKKFKLDNKSLNEFKSKSRISQKDGNHMKDTKVTYDSLIKAGFTTDDIKTVIKDKKVTLKRLIDLEFDLNELLIFFTKEEISAMGKMLPLDWHKKVDTSLQKMIEFKYDENERKKAGY